MMGPWRLIEVAGVVVAHLEEATARHAEMKCKKLSKA
jgi:hypothetical protein